MHLARQMGDPTERSQQIDKVIKDSQQRCPIMYTKAKNQEWDEVKKQVLQQLQQAAKVTAAVYLARYLREDDPDQDNFRTRLEEDVYGTDPFWAGTFQSGVVTKTGLSTITVAFIWRTGIPTALLRVELWAVDAHKDPLRQLDVALYLNVQGAKITGQFRIRETEIPQNTATVWLRFYVTFYANEQQTLLPMTCTPFLLSWPLVSGGSSGTPLLPR